MDARQIKQQLKWAPVLICFTATLGFSLSFYYRAPYHDHWDLVTQYQRLQDGHFQFADLFALHGNHWHASGLLVKLVLAKLTGMAHWAESLASVGFAGLGFVALARLLSRTLERFEIAAPIPAIWIYGVAAFFFFSLDQAGNWLWGWQVSVFINLAGALWAIERLSCGRLSGLNALFAAIAAALAIYAFATGWVLLPIGYGLLLIYGAHRTWSGRRALLIWTAFSGLILSQCVLAVANAPASDLSGGLVAHFDVSTLFGLAHYAINFVASPIVRFARDISVPIAFVGIGILVCVIWACFQRGFSDVLRASAPLLALAFYSGGAALLTALGRWEDYGVKQAFVSRYISFGNLFWIAVFGLAILAIAKLRDRSHRVLIGTLGLLFILKLGNVPSVVQKSVRISADIQAATEITVAQYPDHTPADYAVLHAHGQEIRPHLETLHDHRASFFRHVSRDLEDGSDE